MANDPTTRLLASAPVSTLAPAPQGTDDGAPAPPPRPQRLRRAHRQPRRRPGRGRRPGGPRVPHQQQHRSDGDRGQHVVADRDHLPRRRRVRRRGPDRRPRAGMGCPGGRDVRRVHRVRGPVDPVVGAARLVVVRRQPAAVVPERVRRRRRPGAGWRRGAGPRWWAGWPPRRPRCAPTRCWPRCSPSTLASANDYGRLLAPFGYWNAIGVCAALGLAPALWAATRRAGPGRLRALTIPAMTLMITVIALSLLALGRPGRASSPSRRGWPFVPLRLRSALMLALAGLCAVPIVVVALHSHNLTTDHIPLAAQDAAGHAFGPVLAGTSWSPLMLSASRRACAMTARHAHGADPPPPRDGPARRRRRSSRSPW